MSVDDGNAGTVDACDPAVGVTHTSIVCNDGNACTTDSCNPATGCTTTPLTQSHDKCTTGAALVSGCGTSNAVVTAVCATDSFWLHHLVGQPVRRRGGHDLRQDLQLTLREGWGRRAGGAVPPSPPRRRKRVDGRGAQ